MNDNDSATTVFLAPILSDSTCPTASPAHATQRGASIAAVGWGLLAVAIFALTLPLTGIALRDGLTPTVVSFGRCVGAGIIAGLALAVTRQPLPRGTQWVRILVIFACVCIGFPLLSAWALESVPASHGAVFLALLPIATVILSLRYPHPPLSRSFWVAAVVGAAIVMVFAAGRGVGSLRWADLLLVLAMLAGALTYSESAVLSHTLGSWQVTCWALVVAVPVLGPFVAIDMVADPPDASPTAWGALAWMALVGMLGGFVAWNHAMRIGGINRVSQLQLLQPLLTMLWSALLLKESVSLGLLMAGVGTVLCVRVAQRSTPAKASDLNQRR